MDAIYYKFLFENTNDGIYHIGTVWDTYEDFKLNFIYVCPSTEKVTKKDGLTPRFIADTYPLDYLIIANLSYDYLERVIGLIKNRQINTVIMPYFTPDQRKEIIYSYAKQEKFVSDDMQIFFVDPYQYLINYGVENVYSFLGNGPMYEEEDIWDGVHFDPIDVRIQSQITRLEGYELPVYKAGYIKAGYWLLYFGNYGDGLDSTIVMYHGSIGEDTEQLDSFLCVRNFSKLHQCYSDITSKEYTCEIKCNFMNDHDNLRRHNRDEVKKYINGTFLLGNMKVLGNVEKLYHRFAVIKEHVRVLAVPNSGALGYWDRRLLGFGMEHYKTYWVGPNNKLTQAEMIKDIHIASPHNRYMLLDEYFGVCMSGFLKYKNDYYSL